MPLRALEYDDAFAPHPALVEAAAAALALQLEAAHQTVVAQDREAQLRRLARDVLETEDAARSRLERDLHDGAQQALVGLSLHAALAARGAVTADDSARVRRVSSRMRSTRPASVSSRSRRGARPRLLAERGLDGALGALVLTAGLPVAVDADYLRRPPRAPAARDLVHRVGGGDERAEARRRVVVAAHVAEVGGRHPADVEDDGRGGVVGTPQALAARVAEVDGTIAVSSNGFGTRVTAEFAAAAR